MDINKLMKDSRKIKEIMKRQKKYEGNPNYYLKLYRLCNGYTQKQMAKVLGIFYQTYKRKENRTHGQYFTEPEIRIIHELLGIPYNLFFQYISEQESKEKFGIDSRKGRPKANEGIDINYENSESRIW